MRADGSPGRRTAAHAYGTRPDPPPPPVLPGPEEEPGQERFLRPFAVAAGDPDADAFGVPRCGPDEPDLLSLVVAARVPGRHELLRPEREALLRHALRARTVVELAAEVRLPVGQVRAIVSDMVADGSLQRCGPSRPLGREDLLHAVLVGLRSL
ncbi:MULTISPECIES: DUF742 domain-containing protein [Nocardiopsis]|uniref:DUF742 domain-containing protein n=1 Tax=Nocardiopsis TaxID=2013 RepID=UPI00037D0462|nr:MULTISPECIES: DUF742 domain-containing protein [Nocardiopsis]ASU59482.1 DUF742 domain-containing protein [Nocardiopsis dassonvillei]